MLRASVEYSGGDANLRAITEWTKVGDSGIPHGERLAAFAEAAVSGDGAELATARDALRLAAGSEAHVDAAAVVGNFERMVRIADGTGIPVDGVVSTLSEDLREELGLDAFQTRRVEESGAVAKALGPLLRGAARTALRGRLEGAPVPLSDRPQSLAASASTGQERHARQGRSVSSPRAARRSGA